MKILNYIFLSLLISINALVAGDAYDILNITETVDKYCLAIQTQNKNDFRSLFSQKQQCTLISVGTVFQGLNTIYEDFVLNGIQKAYSKIELIKDEDLKINFINEETAIVIFKYHTECILRESGELYGIKGVETQVLVKEEGKWKIVHIHYSKS